jgi:hypothetical protein
MLVAILQTAVESPAVSPLAILSALLGLQVLAFFWSCFPCCQNCTLFSDNFDRANTTTLSDYTEVVGDWQVFSNRLDTPTNGLLKVNLSTPVSPDGVKISAVCNFGGSTGDMGLMVDYVDSSNYHYAAVVCTGSTTATIRTWQVTGGVATALTTADSISSFSWSADFTIEVCWEDDRIGAAYERGAVTVNQGAMTTANGGNFTGLRSVSVGASARYDDLLVSTLLEGCERCGEVCTECEHGSFQIDIALVADALCADCENVNNSYIVRRIPPDVDCTWGLGELEICTGLDHVIAMNMAAGEVLVVMPPAPWPTGGAAELTWKSTSPSSPCSDWVNEDIPFL